MAYKDTILEMCAVRFAKEAGTDILLPAVCDVNRNSERKVIHGAGKREPYNVFPGKAEVSGTIKDFPLAVEIVGILDLILSDEDGTMKPVEVDDGDARYSGYLTSLKISIPVHDAVMCNLDWVGNAAATSSLTKSAITLDAFIGTGVVLTGIPSDVDFESIDITLTNGLTAKHSARGTSRLPGHLAQGYFDAEVNIKFNEDPGINVLADALAKIATGTITIKSIAGESLVITLKDLQAGDNPRNMNEEDIVDFGLDYSAKSVAFETPT
ncbi:MAG: hypothetical protein PHW65_00945 [Dehalococcoidales bacterium]|nr:hypothetical protein [Dehalococcoidales bacterium]